MHLYSEQKSKTTQLNNGYLPVELVGLLKHAGIDGKILTWDLQVNSNTVSVKLVWIKAGKPVEKKGETTSQPPKKKHLPPGEETPNVWTSGRQKGKPLVRIQLVYKHRQPTLTLLKMKQRKPTSTTATPKPSKFQQYQQQKRSDRHRQDVHILVRYQNQQNSRTIQHLSIAFLSTTPLQARVRFPIILEYGVCSLLKTLLWL